MSAASISTSLNEHAWLLAIGWPALLVAIFLPLSVHTYRRLSR